VIRFNNMELRGRANDGAIECPGIKVCRTSGQVQVTSIALAMILK